MVRRDFVFLVLVYIVSFVVYFGEISFVFIEFDKEKRLNVFKFVIKFLLDWKWYYKIFYFGSFEL